MDRFGVGSVRFRPDRGRGTEESAETVERFHFICISAGLGSGSTSILNFEMDFEVDSGLHV